MTHLADEAAFQHVATVAEGLGPLYNASSCGARHASPVIGGVSQVLELRAGHRGHDGQFRDAEIPINDGTTVIKGRSLVNALAICPGADFPETSVQEHVPESESIRALHASPNLLGDGLVEAVADETLSAIAKAQCRKTDGKICGLALAVPVLESPGTVRIGRFGWKDQHASLLSFVGDAYLNEIGITNRLFPHEVTTLCNAVKEPNDRPGADGLEDIDHLARFIRASKAPSHDAPRASSFQARKGALLFAKIGCAICHVQTLTTVAPGTKMNGGMLTVSDALGNKTFHPYSDFLLHDIGTGDGIVMTPQEHYGPRQRDQWPKISPEGLDESATRMRTAPLWGLRTHATLMHDGASLTLTDAILRHRHEASIVSERFQELTREDRAALEEFLRTL
jgi:CxxC motif-containing protein (DUF1111 family)